MASQQAFVEFVVDQLQEAGDIASRKMFGEYGLYCDGKFFAMICDNQLFVKITDRGRNRFPDLPEAAPYPGAKPHFLVENVDNRELLTALTTATCQALPMPKPKKGK